jgi:hypothetical protein
MAKKVHPNSLANLKMWQPGESGNPAGKPPGTTLTKRLRDIVEKNEGEVADALVKAAVKAALKGDFRFWQEIINRVDGKLPDAIQHTGSDGGPVQINLIRGTPPKREGDGH